MLSRNFIIHEAFLKSCWKQDVTFSTLQESSTDTSLEAFKLSPKTTILLVWRELTDYYSVALNLHFPDDFFFAEGTLSLRVQPDLNKNVFTSFDCVVLAFFARNLSVARRTLKWMKMMMVFVCFFIPPLSRFMAKSKQLYE